jgi:predicted ATPase
MLAAVTISNFLSFRHPDEIRLNHGVNIMVGINGAGKSNFLKAIELLYKTIAENNLHGTVAALGGYENMRNHAITATEPIFFRFEFDCNAVNAVNDTPNPFASNPFYELSIYKVGETAFYIGEKVYVNNPDGRQFVYADVRNGYGYVSARNSEQQQIVREQLNMDGTVSIFKEKIDKQFYLYLHKIKVAVGTFSIYKYFDLSADSKIRKLAPYSVDKMLNPDGGNLVHILNEMSANDIAQFDNFRTEFNQISSTANDILFQNVAGNSLLLVRENGLNRAVPIQFLSEGTIKFMLLLAILLNANSGYLIGIDEPESNLHPDMIATIADKIKLMSESRQLFISTHSPLLLNLFEGDDLLIFEKDAENGTTVRLGNVDEGTTLLGNRWLSGQIGAVRW